MMIAEIGIPPGVDVDREGLQRQVSENGLDLSHIDVLPDRVVAYLWPRASGTGFSLGFVTRMAIDTQSAPYTLFDYYNPDANVTIAPARGLWLSSLHWRRHAHPLSKPVDPWSDVGRTGDAPWQLLACASGVRDG
jgi:hypothetical protein